MLPPVDLFEPEGDRAVLKDYADRDLGSPAILTECSRLGESFEECRGFVHNEVQRRESGGYSWPNGSRSPRCERYDQDPSPVFHSPLTWQKPCSLLQWVMGTAPDFQRAHCLGNSSGRGVCLDLADFTVRVSLF